MMARGNFQGAEKLARRMREHLNRSASYAGVVVLVNPIEMPRNMPERFRRGPNIAELKALLEKNERLFSERLSTMLQNVPSYQRQRVQTIMGQSELWYRIFIEALEDDGYQRGRPFYRVIPPGYANVTPPAPNNR